MKSSGEPCGASIDGFTGKFWDIAVVGAGYAGFAAALAANASGKSVLLLDPECDLLWESSHARNPEAGKLPPEMRPFMHDLECATGIARDWIDPGSAEWVANELLLARGIERLYFATPVSARISSNGLVQSVTFALPGSLAAISAAQWIDATENGLLSRVCGVKFAPQPPIKRIYHFCFQRERWPIRFPVEVFTGIFGVHAEMGDSAWSNEKILRLEVGNAFKGSVTAIIEPLFKAARKRIDAKCHGAVVSHWSISPFPAYAKQATPVTGECHNLSIAVPSLSSVSVDTLGDRCGVGVSAFERLRGMRSLAAPPSRNEPVLPKPTLSVTADVCVAGLGTSGAMAAIAAGRAGAKVVAVEARPAAGGMSTLGAIGTYHLGCSGGLQDELDAEVKRLMPLLCGPGQTPGAFHGLARLWATNALLSKAKVGRLLDTRVIPGSATVKDGRIISILVASGRGIARISARNFVDCTPTGVIAAAAGVPEIPAPAPANPPSLLWTTFAFGKDDELVLLTRGTALVPVPADDAAAMTAARIAGIHKMVESTSIRTSNSFNRITGIAHATGIRQGRLFATRTRITLDDLVERRAFDDAIGFSAGDMAVISGDGQNFGRDLDFYLGPCGLRHMPLACTIPFSALVAEGVSNLLIAGMAGGTAPEASYAVRMMRDLQRKGEAAGTAAALASIDGKDACDAPMRKLKASLVLSGALAPWRRRPSPFGELAPERYDGDPVFCGPESAANVKKWVAALDGPDSGMAMWRLYRLGEDMAMKAIGKPTSGSQKRRSAVASLIAAWRRDP
ncbi:MAG: FAD-dependent oxidoreductase [Kiritimatiellae bacterium]|nr:FAD-dependent oxidoreductase [Kiritimatiellia bacterium]